MMNVRKLCVFSVCIRQVEQGKTTVRTVREISSKMGDHYELRIILEKISFGMGSCSYAVNVNGVEKTYL